MHVFFFFSLFLIFSETLEHDKKASLVSCQSISSPLEPELSGLSSLDRSFMPAKTEIELYPLDFPVLDDTTFLKILSLRKNQLTGDFPCDFINLKNSTHLHRFSRS